MSSHGGWTVTLSNFLFWNMTTCWGLICLWMSGCILNFIVWMDIKQRLWRQRRFNSWKKVLKLASLPTMSTYFHRSRFWLEKVRQHPGWRNKPVHAKIRTECLALCWRQMGDSSFSADSHNSPSQSSLWVYTGSRLIHFISVVLRSRNAGVLLAAGRPAFPESF